VGRCGVAWRRLRPACGRAAATAAALAWPAVVSGAVAAAGGVAVCVPVLRALYTAVPHIAAPRQRSSCRP
jgi:hypothetical protein